MYQDAFRLQSERQMEQQKNNKKNSYVISLNAKKKHTYRTHMPLMA